MDQVSAVRTWGWEPLPAFDRAGGPHEPDEGGRTRQRRPVLIGRPAPRPRPRTMPNALERRLAGRGVRSSCATSSYISSCGRGWAGCSEPARPAWCGPGLQPVRRGRLDAPASTPVVGVDVRLLPRTASAVRQQHDGGAHRSPQIKPPHKSAAGSARSGYGRQYRAGVGEQNVAGDRLPVGEPELLGQRHLAPLGGVQ